jgi:hypothetical protein
MAHFQGWTFTSRMDSDYTNSDPVANRASWMDSDYTSGDPVADIGTVRAGWTPTKSDDPIGIFPLRKLRMAHFSFKKTANGLQAARVKVPCKFHPERLCLSIHLHVTARSKVPNQINHGRLSHPCSPSYNSRSKSTLSKLP